MFKSYRVGSVLGIPLKLDITLLIVLPAFTWLIAAQITEIAEILNLMIGPTIDPEALSRGALPWVLGLIAAIGLFVCVAAHELGHSIVAIHYDYEIDSITLWLLGGLAQFTEQPREWVHEFWIAIAGPIVSVGAGIACYGIAIVSPEQFQSVIFVFGYLAVLNIVLAVFNMIPAFPLDGGRVLRALFTRTRPFPKATQMAVQVGKVFAIILGLFGLLAFNIFLIAIAFFIYIAGAAEGRHTVIASVFEDVQVKEVMTPATDVISVSPDLSVPDLLDMMIEERHSGYPVIENDEIVGIVTIEDIQAVEPDRRSALRVREVMSQDVQTVDREDTAMTAFEDIARSNLGRLVVTDDQDEFVGLITRTDLMRAFSIIRERKLLPSRRRISASGD